MNYDQKIQLLENILAELDNELKVIEAVGNETRNNFFLIHEKVKVHQKNAARLEIEAEESIDLKNWDDSRKKLDEMKQEVTQAESLTDTLAEIGKRGTMNDLEKYRNQNASIRKIAPAVSILIDERIQKLETTLREILDMLNSQDSFTKNSTESDTKIEKARLMENELILTISLAQKCIKSTLDTIRN